MFGMALIIVVEGGMEMEKKNVDGLGLDDGTTACCPLQKPLNRASSLKCRYFLPGGPALFRWYNNGSSRNRFVQTGE
jgi:hypothetical protein